MTISSITPAVNVKGYNTPSFKGVPKLNAANVKAAANKMAQAKDGLWDKFIEKGIIQPIIKPLVNSKFMNKFADWSANMDNLPSHMATAGSIVTTYFYANRTLKTLNKDEEEKRRARVLVLNQGLVCGVSTALAYGANSALGKFSKNLGEKFQEVNVGRLKKDVLTSRMKGFDIAKQLLIFTMMYRFVAPVFVTPVASKLGKVYQNWQDKKAANAQPNPVQQTPVNNQNEVKKA